MKTSRIFTSFARTLATAACILGSSVFALAQTCPATTAAGITCVASGGNLNISAHTICAKVANSHASGKALMVSTGTPTEWLSLRTSPPAGVTTGACGACTASSQFITASGAGNVTVPANCTTVMIEAWGGGGAGAVAGTNVETRSGASGGSGGYTQKVVTVTPGTSIAYTVGAASGNTTVSGMTAGGGVAGALPPVGPGAGGTATGGTVNTPGNGGTIGLYSGATCLTNVSGSTGGTAPTIAGGAGGAGGAVGANGQPGSVPGGGGGGGGLTCSGGAISSAGTGGAGSNGGVRFTWSD